MNNTNRRNASKPSEKVQKRPRRNRSAFIFYSSAVRASLSDQERRNSNRVMIDIGLKWRQLPAEEKTTYQEMAKDDKIRFEEECALYLRQNPLKTLKNKTKYSHKKKPCSAYAMFVKATLQKTRNPKNKENFMSQYLSDISKKWRKLDDDTKDYYQRLADEEKMLLASKILERPARKRRSRSKIQQKSKEESRARLSGGSLEPKKKLKGSIMTVTGREEDLEEFKEDMRRIDEVKDEVYSGLEEYSTPSQDFSNFDPESSIKWFNFSQFDLEVKKKRSLVFSSLGQRSGLCSVRERSPNNSEIDEIDLIDVLNRKDV